MDQQSRHLRSIDRSLRTGGLLVGLVFAFWVLRDILILIFAAALIACVLRAAAVFVHRKSGLGVKGSLLAVCVSVLLAIGAFLGWRGMAIANDAGEVGRRIQSQGRQLWHKLGQSEWGGLVADQLRSAADTLNHNLGGYLPGIANSLLGAAGSLVVILATATFFAASPWLYINGALRLLPPHWRKAGAQVLQQIGITLEKWFAGQLVDMLVVACVAGTGLYLLGVPFALTLALIAGLLNFVPYFGAIAGSIPAIVVAFSQSPAMAFWVALLFMTVQIVEGNVLAPMIQRRAAALPPAVTILSQTILGSLFGIMGLVFATPLAAAMLVAIRMIYVEKILEGRPTGT